MFQAYLLIGIFLLNAAKALNLSTDTETTHYQTRFFRSNSRKLQDSSSNNNFQLIAFDSFLAHYNFTSIFATNLGASDSDLPSTFYAIMNYCSQQAVDIDQQNLNCTLLTSGTNQSSSFSQSVFMQFGQAQNYTFESQSSVLTYVNVPATVTTQYNSEAPTTKACILGQTTYSFINSETNTPFQYETDGLAYLSIKVGLEGGNCSITTNSPLLETGMKNGSNSKIVYYVLLMTGLGAFQIIACYIMSKKVARSDVLAKRTSLGTLCFLIMFDVFLYFTHFTYWTSISVWMAPVFMIFFILSVFFEPVLLYYVFTSLQRRMETSILRLLSQLYLWLLFAGTCLLISLLVSPDILFYVFGFVLIPQIVNHFNNNLRNKWNLFFMLGLCLPKLIYIVYRTFDPFNIFDNKINPRILVIISVMLSLQIIVLQIQTKYPTLGFKSNVYSYLCNQTEVISMSSEVCSICTEQLSQKPIIGLQQPLMEQDELNTDIYKTPCKHYFHQPCLEEWAKKKLECPNCRQRIPLLDVYDD